MARSEYGAGVADYVVTPSDGQWGVGVGAVVTFWDRQVDGNRYTDLLNAGGGPITSVTADEHGSLPRFFGPDGVTGMWADAGGGARAWMDAHSLTFGAPGEEEPIAVASVNGITPDVTGNVALASDNVGAVPSASLGVANGVATLGGDGILTPGQRPTYTAAQVGALATTARGAANGVAALGADGKVPAAQVSDDRLVVGETGRRYRIISGTIRNSGSGWGLISDSSHRSSGISAVNALSDRIELQHPIGAIRVSSLQATPDETFAARGLRVGASVGLDTSTLFLYDESPDFITDRVYYDGPSSSWKSERGVFSGFAFSGGVLTLTHADMGTTTQSSASLAGRGGLGAFVGALTATTTQVVFYSGSFGSLTAVTSPATTMNVYVTRYGKRAVPAATPSSIVSSTGNIWITGLAEI
ncbi:hypothetical protein ACFVAF_36810 [Streptomyces sp. NPDC057596]|uniref:hypothetical protein n=1 Tax=Streptomyces sp. NPDC057596 TaxID=3346178 RepID=UPI0036828339